MAESDALPSEWMVEKLNEARESLDNNEYCYKFKKFEPYFDLLQENDESLKRKSNQRRSRRLRARAILLEIYQSSGLEVLVLCNIAVTITKLGEMPLSVSKNVNSWWERSTCSIKLSTIAKTLCTKYPIEILDSTSIVPGIRAQTLTVAETFESAINIAAKSISGTEKRNAWVLSCLDNLHSLKRLIYEGDGIQEVVPETEVQDQAGSTSGLGLPLSQSSTGPTYQGATEIGPGAASSSMVPQALDANQVEESDLRMAVMAVVARLERVLGSCLFKGMEESRTRHREVAKRLMTFTSAVRLHLAYEEGEDFKIEVWICSSLGKAISEANKRSVEDLRNMLGDFLFGAMEASNWRKQEESMRVSSNTGAVDVSFFGDDCKLEVRLNFEIAWGMWAELYPS